jgi:phospho-N-acetylmuramoyl-pentapeptide-transferase
MFYHLLHPLTDVASYFNLFRYITFRSAAATVTALIISLLLGPSIIRKLNSGAREDQTRGAEKPLRQGRHTHYGRADHVIGNRDSDSSLG